MSWNWGTEVELDARFLQERQDWADISSELEPTDRVRTTFNVTKDLEHFEQAGFVVLGAGEIYRVAGVAAASDWPCGDSQGLVF